MLQVRNPMRKCRQRRATHCLQHAWTGLMQHLLMGACLELESEVNEWAVIRLTVPSLKGVHMYIQQKYLMPRDETKNTASHCYCNPRRREKVQLTAASCILFLFDACIHFSSFFLLYMYTKAAQVNERWGERRPVHLILVHRQDWKNGDTNRKSTTWQPEVVRDDWMSISFRFFFQRLFFRSCLTRRWLFLERNPLVKLLLLPPLPTDMSSSLLFVSPESRWSGSADGTQMTAAMQISWKMAPTTSPALISVSIALHKHKTEWSIDRIH